MLVVGLQGGERLWLYIAHCPCGRVYVTSLKVTQRHSVCFGTAIGVELGFLREPVVPS